MSAVPTRTRAPGRRVWKILAVDDEADVHTVTRLVLRDLQFEGRGVELLEALSGAEARELLQQHQDIALILLDVVMSTEHEGLDLVPYVRETLGNRAVRIVLRTGQPGSAPPLEMLARYEIDDYRGKTELTAERLKILVMSALRGYRKMRELMDANRELEQFANAASHDLQTPVRGIVSMAELLRKRLTDRRPEVLDLLDFIAAAGRDLHHLIASLLRYATLGRQAEVEETVRLDDVVRNALARLHGLILERGAVVRADPLPAVTGVAYELEQLFANLIENAIKYQAGPAPNVTITSRVLGGVAEIRVTDRGMGIDAAQLNRIFEPFVRLHSKDAIPGSGIGLAICRKVVERHGGTLHAESTPGTGTTMLVRLPAPADPTGGSAPLFPR